MATGLPPDTSAEIVRLARECPLLAARRLKASGSFDLTIGTTPTRFNHGLGRRPENFIASPIGGAGVVFRVDDDGVSPPADPTREIVLRASVTTLCRVLLY